MDALESKFVGSLLGLAIGDALGTTVEFQKGGFAPLTDIIGGGKFGLLAGQFTDDTSTMLCLATSLIEKEEFDPIDQLERYLKWYRDGVFGSNFQCFDIGITTRTSVLEFEKTREPYPASTTDKSRAGNGSLMRLAPVPLLYYKDPPHAYKFAELSSRTTHGSQIAIDACIYFAELMLGILQGKTKEELLNGRADSGVQFVPEIQEIINGSYKIKNPPEIEARGYVVKSLEAVLWAFYHTDNFKDGLLKVVNLGDDADTTGAIYGQLAGLFYGFESIPQNWIEKVWYRDIIIMIARQIFAMTKGEGVKSKKDYEEIMNAFHALEEEAFKIRKRIEPGPGSFKQVFIFHFL
eukprot:TRINITY_DN4680_c1_g1_i1.p1 TRINITY_DN4680_c1_g1~~TRINITY_DN4680_c1_g1_i1.p1  ORF type:complete len:350 (+),score=57.23 TRINITY_DN4680_c1_g1_i1:79-1128(+)